MPNRNVNQLPENTDPQDTDWILGASGNSPSVLQKIAVGNLKPDVDIPTKVSELENDAKYLPLDLTGIENGQSVKWDSTLQKFVFFSPSPKIEAAVIYGKSLIIQGTAFINLPARLDPESGFRATPIARGF